MNYVYFAQALDGGPIKIGISRDPARRVASLSTASSAGVDLLVAIPGTHADEALVHDRFASGRLNGEWFSEDTPGLAEFIETLIAPDLSDPEVAFIHRMIRACESTDLVERREVLAEARVRGYLSGPLLLEERA